MKNVFICGGGSYIGKNLYRWLSNYPEQYKVTVTPVKNGAWRKADFHVDTVVDVAGLAHINHITEDMKPQFYAVNKDLTRDIADHAKQNGVQHFVYLSSLNVYGDLCGCITDADSVEPSSFYGDSKLQGEKEIQKMADDSFRISIIRPPFVYGKGCSGNYKKISKIAKMTPFFPDYKQRKSMIYIDNLSEFIRLVVEREADGTFLPQNIELVSTCDLVEEIRRVHGRKLVRTKIFNIFIKGGLRFNKDLQRAFSDDCIDPKLSGYFNNEYSVVDFGESIRRTEA